MSAGTDYSEFWAEALEAPYKAYWESLGRFVSEFSATELSLLYTIKAFADLEAELARAIFGGVRLQDGISALNRVLIATGRTRTKRRLVPVLKQLAEINTTRNNIIHWGTTMVSEGVFLVTNKEIVHSGQIPQHYTVTPRELSDMTMDLIKIRIHLSKEGERDRISRLLYRKVLRPIVHAPWSYRVPQRAAPPQKSSRKRSTRKAPPEAFEG